MTNLKQTVLLIDGNSFLYRAYYGSLSLAGKSGGSTNAVYTAIKMLKKFLEEAIAYKNIYVFFDAGKKTHRHQAYKDYKIKRKKTPEDLAMQIPIFKEFLKTAQITFFEDSDYEADDLISSAAELAKKANMQAEIISTDRDLLQTIGPQVSQIFLKKGVTETEKITEANFFAKFAISPQQIPDWKGLAGDKSDNIPGVRGIGDKTTLNLLKTYGNIENIYQNLEKITEKQRVLLTAEKANALMSKKLATIVSDIPVKINFSAPIYNLSTANMKEFYVKYKMFSLLKKPVVKHKNKQKQFFF